MEKKKCPICGDECIKELCYKCNEKKDSGYIALIEVDETKSREVKKGFLVNKNAYRTGRVFHVKKEVFRRIFNSDESGNFVFIQIPVGNFLQKHL